MTAVGRIFTFILLTAMLAAGALWITRESLRPQGAPQQIGLAWLREEYHLDESTFAQIRALHGEYFKRCDSMCRQINEADRPLLWRGRNRARNPGELSAQINREQAICADCETAAIEHLRQVAALMPAHQGRRFLSDILPVLKEQRREHDRRVSSSLSR